MESKLIINNFKAKKIAYCIYNDIATYINSHSKEFEEWKNRKEIK